ncbi:MAG: vWA domain-containing protein [Gammaproteobacteria bacterium]
MRTLKQLDEIPPPGSQTKIGDALNTVLQTGATTPLSGIILITDGGENGGTLSEERLAQISAFGVPVHTVGVGPEQIPNDLELDSVTLADTASPGEVLNAEVSIRHSAKGKTRLRVYDGEKLLAANDVTLTSDAGRHHADHRRSRRRPRRARPALHARSAAERAQHHQQHAHARDGCDATPGETSSTSRASRAGIQVHPPRRRTDQSLRLASMVRATPNRYYRQGIEKAEELAGGFPKKTEELFAYDAVIIGSFEATALTPEQHEALKSSSIAAAAAS